MQKKLAIILMPVIFTLICACSSDTENNNKNENNDKKQTLQNEDVLESSLEGAAPPQTKDVRVEAELTVPETSGAGSFDYTTIGFEILKEEFGTIKYGLKDHKVIKIIGEADQKSEEIVWGADEKGHQTWSYREKGLELDMVRDEEIQTIDMIKAAYPCEFETIRNIGIGSTMEEVIEAYNGAINQEESYADQIVVGSVYGGIIFTFENNAVSEIFIGAAFD